MEKLFKKLCKLTGEAVVKYKMIDPGDRILVGLSGGKDSFALLHTLSAMRRKSPVKFELIAATFDPGFPEFNASAIADYCCQMGWEHRIISLPIAEIIEEKKFTHAPCVLCSRLRRGKLYGLAKEFNCNKLALGQHLDDIIVSFLMSFCRGQGITTMGPNVPVKAEKNLRIIRPFALVPESLIKSCQPYWNLPTCGKCRYEAELQSGDREFFRNLVDQLVKRIPNLHSQAAHSLGNLQPEYLLDTAYLKKI